MSLNSLEFLEAILTQNYVEILVRLHTLNGGYETCVSWNRIIHILQYIVEPLTKGRATIVCVWKLKYNAKPIKKFSHSSI